ncbi:MAG: cytochrome c biogenesis protein [Chlorobiota bacterium]
MKYVLLLAGLTLGILIAVVYPPERARPLWWQLVVIALVTGVLLATLLPPIGGSLADAVVANRLGQRLVASLPLLSSSEVQQLQRAPASAPVLLRCVGLPSYDTVHRAWRVSVEDLSPRRYRATALFPTEPPPELLQASSAVVELKWTGSDTLWTVQRVAALEPWVVLPYIPGLEERARILYFHVPFAWGAVVAYAIAMIAALQYLRRREPKAELRAVAAAGVGTLFTVLATVTGAIWARFNWGAFWNWDPRQTTIVVLLLIYLAYFALRSSLPEGEQRARLSSVYLVFAFVTVPFLVFVLPRMMESLHPGGRGDATLGPLVDPSPEALNLVKQVLFSGALLAFTALFGWLWSLAVRVLRLSQAVELQTEAHHGVPEPAQ